MPNLNKQSKARRPRIRILGVTIFSILITVTSYGMIIKPVFGPNLFILQSTVILIFLFFFIRGVLHSTKSIENLHRNIRIWIKELKNNKFSAKLPNDFHSKLNPLINELNQFGHTFQQKDADLHKQVDEQTDRLIKKTRSLEILYDVAASSNSARDIDDLLNRFLVTLTEILYAHAGTVRVLTDDDNMRLIGSVGIDDQLVEQSRDVPVEHCICAHRFTEDMIVCQNSYQQCGNLIGELLFDKNNLDMIAIPLRYNNQTLGIYNLFVESLGLTERQDIKDILANIGQHLSLAIEKARVDHDMQRLSIIQERNMLAHELHDSLAQTLASLRFQIRMLDESLKKNDDITAKKEVHQLKDGLDQANSELRQLLSQFRIHMDERGVIPATETLIDRLHKETGISTYIQKECDDFRFSPTVEVHVLHIIQEALANIRKHSQAKQVRILFRNEDKDFYYVLIEDDGIGFLAQTSQNNPGEHIGLTIMKERTENIHGTLHIEGEPNEGTRIELEFFYPPKQQSDTIRTALDLETIVQQSDR